MRAKQISWADKLPEVKKLAKVKTKQELAEHFGVSVHAVSSTLQRYGIKAKPERPTKIQSLSTKKLREMRQTMNGAAIARQLGVSVGKLCAHLKKHGITGPVISTRSSTVKKAGTPKPVDAPKKEIRQSLPATAQIIYPDGFKITRYISEPCCDIRSPMKRENYDPKMHAASYGYSRL